jgi:two-component system KDP operon response regulator KdpE
MQFATGMAHQIYGEYSRGGQMPANSGVRIGNNGIQSGTPAAGHHVLLVSDDREVGGLWAYALREMGLDVALTTSAADALLRWEQDTFDLFVIDVCGPDLDGVELTRQLRAGAVNPILLFASQRDEPHALQAYQAGVDEYIVKPVSPSLFLAKIRAWLRRSWTVPARALESIQAGPLLLDPAKRQVTTESGAVVRLTNLEFRVLHLVMSHPNQVLPSELIVDRVWGLAGGGDSILLKNVVYRLRRKIEPDSAHPRYLQTVAGEGYVYCPA